MKWNVNARVNKTIGDKTSDAAEARQVEAYHFRRNTTWRWRGYDECPTGRRLSALIASVVCSNNNGDRIPANAGTKPINARVEEKARVGVPCVA